MVVLNMDASTRLQHRPDVLWQPPISLRFRIHLVVVAVKNAQTHIVVFHDNLQLVQKAGIQLLVTTRNWVFLQGDFTQRIRIALKPCKSGIVRLLARKAEYGIADDGRTRNDDEEKCNHLLIDEFHLLNFRIVKFIANPPDSLDDLWPHFFQLLSQLLDVCINRTLFAEVLVAPNKFQEFIA